MIMRLFGVETPTNLDFVFKGACGAEVLMPTEVGKHMPYDPKLLPVKNIHAATELRLVLATWAVYKPSEFA